MPAQTDPVTVKIRDESVPRSEVVEALLALTSAQLTARALISERVRMDVDRRLMDQNGLAAPRLVAPAEKEAQLNTPRRIAIDAEAQVEVALAAFEANGFVLLVDDRQIESLDAPIALIPDTVVTFLKLTPLVGG